MRLRIRLDTSTLSAKHQSGVASYTSLLSNALSSDTDIAYEPIRKPPLPIRLYTKLHSYHLAPPYDLFLPSTDLTIFPNFAKWPTIKSKTVATVIHDLTYLYYPEFVEKANLRYLRRVVPHAARRSDVIITMSETVKGELIKEFGLPRSKIIVTPIPPAAIFFEKSTIDVIEKYKIPTNKYIYFIGNLEPRKNITALIHAYRALPTSIKNEYSLIIAGSKGWKSEAAEAELEKAAKDGENIKHIGRINQTDNPALYQNAALFVMPSLYEGFGIPVLEAMASGTPVLCSDIPVLHETGGNACLYTDTSSTNNFSAQIKSVLTSPALQKQLRTDGLRRATSYIWSKNVHTIKDKLI